MRGAEPHGHRVDDGRDAEAHLRAKTVDVPALRGQVDRLLEEKLKELTPEIVKSMMERVIRDHLGWLIVWGNVFGAAIGLLAVAVAPFLLDTYLTNILIRTLFLAAVVMTVDILWGSVGILTFGQSADEIPSWPEVEPELSDVFERHAGELGLELRNRCFLWKAVFEPETSPSMQKP